MSPGYLNLFWSLNFIDFHLVTVVEQAIFWSNAEPRVQEWAPSDAITRVQSRRRNKNTSPATHLTRIFPPSSTISFHITSIPVLPNTCIPPANKFPSAYHVRMI